MTNDIAGDVSIVLRGLDASDAAGLADFANAVPAHDLLFLARDIRNPRVVSAWLNAIAEGSITSLAAEAGGRIVATTAVRRDPLGWSSHVAEIRVLVLPDYRGKGLGRALLEASLAAAADSGAVKMVAQVTPDQTSAISLFEEFGFRAEALLRDHLHDSAGSPHDLVILSLDRARADRIAGAYR